MGKSDLTRCGNLIDNSKESYQGILFLLYSQKMQLIPVGNIDSFKPDTPGHEVGSLFSVLAHRILSRNGVVIRY
jgi:hypothetical protein